MDARRGGGGGTGASRAVRTSRRQPRREGLLGSSRTQLCHLPALLLNLTELQSKLQFPHPYNGHNSEIYLSIAVRMRSMPGTNLGTCSCLLLYAGIWIIRKHSYLGNFDYLGN